MTDTMNNAARPWLCYDAECALCVRWAERFRSRLEKCGFALLPLQSPIVRATLQLPEKELLKEMRVITTGGRIYGGADALAYIGRVAHSPLFWLTRIPGAMPLLRAAYRILARNRNCTNGACHSGTGVSPVRFDSHRRDACATRRMANLADWLPLLILGSATAVIGRKFPAWLYMWTLTFALFAGCKWLVLRNETKRVANVGLGRKLGFLFGWIGMDAAEFFAKTPTAKRPAKIEFAFATLKILFGSVLIWFATPRALAVNPLLAGWTGMVGLVFILHFGLFHMLALIWRANGIRVTPLMRAPLLSRSLGEFWGKRWNTAFNRLAAQFLFRPMHRAIGASAASMLVFLVSGLVHDLVISVPARGGYGLPTLYFLAQGAGTLFERTPFARRIGLNRGFRGWLFTLIVTAGPVFWLFHPAFIRNVILPFLKTIGAT
jgi:predicted DCC family thiol-disulfide oxidoreductase YuxK